MLSRNICKKKEHIFCVSIGLYMGAVFWITLFSRIGSDSRSFLWPLNSYFEIVKGNKSFLIENIANVFLFIPLGIILKCIDVKGAKRVAVVGLLISLLIELLQATFALGTFECDDLIHNMLGAIAGYYSFKRIDDEFQIKLCSKMSGIILLSITLCLLVPFGHQGILHQKMVRLAMLHDRKDGAKNLLVLNGRDGNAWDNDLHIKYLDDGGICVSGGGHGKSWKRIADLKLDSGVYEISNLISCSDNSVKLYVAPYKEDKDDYVLQYIKPMEQVLFELTKTTKVRVYLSVESGNAGSTQLMPVIYRIK